MNLLQTLFGPPLPSVSAAELSEKLKNGKRPLVLDVRQPEEFRAGHIQGAKLIPLNELSRRLNELPQNREIVCVCATGNRSRSATKQLARAGYPAVNLNGGMLTEEMLAAKQQPVTRAPDDERPPRAMPETTNDHRREQIEVFPPRGDPITAQRDIDVVP